MRKAEVFGFQMFFVKESGEKTNSRESYLAKLEFKVDPSKNPERRAKNVELFRGVKSPNFR